MRPFDFEPGHWKKQLPKKYLDVARKGDLAEIEALLRAHPDFLTKRGSHGRTLLWEAARAGRMAAVALLVESGADVDATGCYNGETLVQITPYCAARHYRRGAVADYLWERGSTLDVFRAAFLGDHERVERELAAQPALLTAEDPHDDIYFVPLLSFAVAGGHPGLARFLIRRGAPVAPYSAQLLTLAARTQRRDLVDLLLAGGADPRAVDVGIFVDADLDLLGYLLSLGASPHGRAAGSMPPLVYVARGDKGEHPDKVSLLLDRGADVDATGRNGKTALHYAAVAGHASVVRLLLDRGADAAIVDADGRTALELARAAGKDAAVAVLAARGARA